MAHVASAEWARFYDDTSEATFEPEDVWRDLDPVDWLVTAWADGRPMMQPALWLIPRPLLERAGLWREERSPIDDFDRLQHWLGVMIEEDTHYITQGLSSLIFAGQNCAVAPPNEYVVSPSLPEGTSPTVTLHHYVAESKRAYFRYGWRHIV